MNSWKWCYYGAVTHHLQIPTRHVALPSCTPGQTISSPSLTLAPTPESSSYAILLTTAGSVMMNSDSSRVSRYTIQRNSALPCVSAASTYRSAFLTHLWNYKYFRARSAIWSSAHSGLTAYTSVRHCNNPSVSLTTSTAIKHSYHLIATAFHVSLSTTSLVSMYVLQKVVRASTRSIVRTRRPIHFR